MIVFHLPCIGLKVLARKSTSKVSKGVPRKPCTKVEVGTENFKGCSSTQVQTLSPLDQKGKKQSKKLCGVGSLAEAGLSIEEHSPW